MATKYVEDPISRYRTEEYDYLMSDEFVQDLERYQIQLISRPFEASKNTRNWIK